MTTGGVARALVRLYPRRWRARYEDEMLALIGETPLTLSALVDLVAGAAREWIHTAVRSRRAPQPVSLQREFWRDFARSLLGTGTIAFAS